MGPRPRGSTVRPGTGTPNRARAVCRPGTAAHPRARTSQRPPAGDWRVWCYVGGRGAGKTRAGAGWVQHRVETGVMKRGCLIAPTMADIRDVMVDGPSGLLAVAPPWCRPQFSPSKRRVSWPNGARGLPERRKARSHPRGERRHPVGRRFRLLAASRIDLGPGDAGAAGRHQSPGDDHDDRRRLAVLKRVLDEATTVQTTDSTYANQPHLPREFIDQIVGLYQNTRLGQQEIYAVFLDTTEGVWFARFDPARHVSVQAEYDPIYHVRCAIDAGASRHTAAVFYQIRHNNGVGPPRVTVFGDYHALDVVSRKNAFAIKELANQLPCHGKIDCVRLDPAAAARTSLGPAAYAEYEQVFGSRLVARWPRHLVLDGLEMLDLLLESGNLLIHPRCTRLRDAFQTYARQRRGGEWIDYPADGHPEEDMIDALRGGVRDAFPEGLVPPPNLRPVHAGRVLG